MRFCREKSSPFECSEIVLSSILLYRAAQLFSKPKKIVGRKDNLNTLLPSKEFGQGTPHGPTQGLSIGD